MKQYKTLEELIAEISATGMIETTTEAAIHYQDLIGHSTTETLYNLANGPQNQEFYKVYGIAYGTIAAIKCYMEFSQKQIDLRSDLDEAKSKLELRMETILELKKNYDSMFETAEKHRQAWVKATEETKEAQKKIEAQAAEITQLKARLYDLITANQ